MACDPDRYAPCVIPDGPVILQGDEPTKWQISVEQLASSGFDWTLFWWAVLIIAIGAAFIILDIIWHKATYGGKYLPVDYALVKPKKKVRR